MGLEEIGSGDGHIKLDRGDNALVTIQNLDLDEDEYQGQRYKKLSMVFDAVNENDRSQQGTLPFWPSSKITISDSEEHSSDLGKMLKASGELRTVLGQLIDDSDAVDRVVNGDLRWEASTDEENEELGKAVASALKNKTFRVGTKQQKDGKYSIIKEFYKAVDEDPFSGDESDQDSESDSGSDQEESSGDDVIFGEDDDDGEDDVPHLGNPESEDEEDGEAA